MFSKLVIVIVNLFIVESPAKAKTIGQYLGKNFAVVASMGHVRELVPKNGSVDVDNDFKMKFQTIEKSKKQVAYICKLAEQAEKIYLASDPDREGEAISQSLYEILINKKVAKAEQFYRVSYTEITKQAIEYAIKNTRKIDANLVDAQQARQALDYLVGFNLSPVLWRKLPGCRSAGRVQSVALRMIVDREFEIKAFKPSEYWSIDCILRTNGGEDFVCNVVKFNDKKFENGVYPQNEQTAQMICDSIEKAKQFKVIKNETKDVKQNPYPPFTTSLLQQNASRKLGFSSKMTMNIAQRLYEGVQIDGKTIALITYMRTDGMTLSADAVRGIRNIISSSFGKDYLPDKAIAYKTKTKNAQEAHEAIRPTHMDITPEHIREQVEPAMYKLYDLIWRRTIACQMNSAIYNSQSVELEADDGKNKTTAKANGKQLKFNGWLAVYGIKTNDNKEQNIGEESNESGDTFLPFVSVGEMLDAKKNIKEQHFTNPPARYNEASLIKTMESYGIGRPSTYATIISVLQDREYVKLEKKQFIPTPRGMLVCVFLKQWFERYVEYNFTAKLEEDLDLISDGKEAKVKFLSSFWKDFNKNVKDISGSSADVVYPPISKIFNNYFFSEEKKQCPKCGSEVLIKSGKFGVFFGCSNYPKCNYVMNLVEENGKLVARETSADAKEDGVERIIKHQQYGDITIKIGRYGRYCEFQKNGKVAKKTLPDGEITDDILNFYISLPKTLGKDSDGNDIQTNIGRFGPYVLNNGKFYSYKEKPYEEITLEKAVETIENAKNNSKKVSSKSKSFIKKTSNSSNVKIKTSKTKKYTRSKK